MRFGQNLEFKRLQVMHLNIQAKSLLILIYHQYLDLAMFKLERQHVWSILQRLLNIMQNWWYIKLGQIRIAKSILN